MEFDTWEELAQAFLGAFGPQPQADAQENLQAGLAGAFGAESRDAYSNFTDDLTAALESGEITWQGDGAPVVSEISEPDEEEVQAAEERMRNAAAEEVMHNKVERLEEKIGRGLTDAEEDEIIDNSLGEAARDDPAGIDLVRDHAEKLKGKLDNPGDRLEIMESAGQRKIDEGFDLDQAAEEAVAEVEGMSDYERRIVNMAGAGVLAQEGMSYDDFAVSDGDPGSYDDE